MTVVTVEHLSKSYGTVRAVEDFSINANKGEIVALVGPDGAGKTSIFRALCGLITYDAGQVTVAGYDIATSFDKVKPHLGYMPQLFSLYPDLSVEENLYFFAGLFGLDKKKFNEKKKRLYEFSGLGPFYNRRSGALSGGMKQKLALSCALVHDPEVLVLDEPTTGVDPLSRRQFWEILKDLRRGGSAILVSTPYMDEVALSDRATFIFEGKKLAEGTPAELARLFRGAAFRLKVEPTHECMQKLVAIDGLTSRRFGSSVHIYIGADSNIADFYPRLGDIGVVPEMIEPIMPELEDTFIQLMGK
jgi:ABC-type multidrug transport system ATPase subunit